MIKNPSQYQINLAIEAGDHIVARKPSFFMKVFDKFMQTITGLQPNMVTYNNEIYDSRLVVIYSKAEMYSFMSRGIDATLYNTKNPNNLLNRKFDVDANINYVIMDLGRDTIKIDFYELYNLLEDVKNKYNNLIENPKSMEYKQLNRTQVESYKDDEYIYNFKNGFRLDLTTVQNMKTKKIKICEQFFGLETKDFNTEQEAFEEMSDILKERINICISNPLVDDKKMLDRERIGENSSIEI